ncbi:MAG: biotin/lipoyl-containing protein, partial [Pirellula sp.]
MATEIKLPSLGEGIESGDVLEILVSIGDVIKKGQSLIEMETDKATVSVPSSHAGKILSISVKEGQTVPIGGVIATIEAVAAASAPATPPPTPAAPTSTPATVAVPPQPAVATPAATPAQVNVTAPLVVPPTPPVPATPVPAALQPSTLAPVGSPFGDEMIPAGPAIRRFAREVGVDLSEV